MFFRFPRVHALRIPLIISKLKTPLSSAIFLIYSFAGLIVLGTLLLLLPISSRSGEWTPPLDALFTATSAVCVTGLVVVDTGTYWSLFGQGVLLALFQLGGLGFIAGALLLLSTIGRGLGLREKFLVNESIGIDRAGSVIGSVLLIILFSLLFEAIGAVIFFVRALATSPSEASLWISVFHAVSAFNNCGMDLFGNYQSLLGFRSDTIVLITTAGLIILGSTGFFVLGDIIRAHNLRRLSLDTKIAIATSLSLIAFGTLFYFIAEFGRTETLGDFPFYQKLLVAFFQSVSPRTAGFTVVDIGKLREITLFFTMFLMLVGGTSGSVSGGVKVNTLGVLVLSAINSIRGKRNIEAFGRELTAQNVYRALALLLVYLMVIAVVTIILSITETSSLDSLLFETISALGTVGLSTGITHGLSAIGRLIITLTMFIGRLGPLTIMAAMTPRLQTIDRGYPHDVVRIG